MRGCSGLSQGANIDKMWNRSKQWGRKNWLILLITVVGFILRVIGLQFGKPFRFHPDEIKLVWQAVHLLDYPNWSRETVFLIGVYPPFFTYVLAILFAAYNVLMLLVGHFPSISALGEIYILNPFQYHLLGRWISALSGTATILLVYWAGKKLYSRTTAIIASAFLAVTFLHVRNSHFGVVDVFLTMLIMLSFVFSIKIFHQGKARNYILAALFASLAIATKWNAGLILFVLILAHLFSSANKEPKTWRWLFHRHLILAGVVAALVFLIVCPMVWLDFKEFWGGLVGTAEFQKSGSGKLGAGGNFWSYFTGNHSPGYGFFYDNNFTLAMGAVATILFSLGILFLLWRHRKEDVLVLAFPILMYVVIGQMSYKAMRQLLPVVPFLLLIAAELLVSVFKARQKAKYQLIIITLAVGSVVVPQGLKSLRYDIALNQTDTRILMKDWIESNIAQDSKIGLEEFGPPLLSSHDLNLQKLIKSPHYRRVYDVYGLVPRMFAHGKQRTDSHNPVNYIIENRIQYIVLDGFTRSRYTWNWSKKKNPEAVRARAQFYKWVKENCQLLHQVRPKNNFHISPELEVYSVVY